ncbi:MAG: MFS transporter [Chloroflexi bacterium]|nr:MFS transporter [Chloroflexota bacterium]
MLATARTWPRAIIGVNYPRATLVAVAFAYLSAQVGMSPVSPMLPTMADFFNVGIASVTWVMTAYLLTMSSLVIAGGRLGDILGHRVVFMWGTAVFAVGGLLSGLAPGIGLLIGMRALQGAGSALLLGNSLALVADAFPESQRGRAVGIAVTGAAMGSFLGLVMAGAFVQYLDWRWLFYVTALLGGLSSALAWRLRGFPENHPKVPGATFDITGAVLLFGALAALILSAYHLHGGEPSFQAGLPYHAAMLGGFLLLAGLFVVVERRKASPLVNLSYFRRIPFSFSSVANLVLHWNMAVTMMIPFLVEKGLGLRPWYTTLALVTGLGFAMLLSPLSGWLYDRTRSWLIRPVAMTLMAVTLFMTAALGSGLTFWGFYILLTFRGIASGLFLTPNNTAIISAVPSTWRGFATGVLETTRQLGHTVGVALASLVFVLFLPLVGATPQDYVRGFLATTVAVGVITTVGGIMSGIAGWSTRKDPPPRRR